MYKVLTREMFRVTSTSRNAQNVKITIHHYIEGVKGLPHMCPCNQSTNI